ncbi:MAG: GNAT family N-acetyltransferase [Pirellulales bacterium]|nr:GNAT family N-acetyltransferase [Pirellulales bacterium]
MRHASYDVVPVPPALREQALRLLFRGAEEVEREQLVAHFLSELARACPDAPAALGSAASSQFEASSCQAVKTEQQPGILVGQTPAAVTKAEPSFISAQPGWLTTTRNERLLLLGVFGQQHLLGAVLLELLGGGAAMLWPACLETSTLQQADELLMRSALMAAKQGGTRLTQCLLRPGDTASLQRLRRHGFHEVAELVYLYCDAEHFPKSPPGGPLEFEPYRPSEGKRLTSLVEGTYQHSLDCPALNGVRTAEQAVAGYAAACQEGASWWQFARLGGKDAGCLLVARHEGAGSCELTYMGLLPEYRGRGLGLQMVLHALWLARVAGCMRMVAAVDLNNVPAVQHYVAAGFRAWDRRVACICLLD